jgi:iron complex transport system substrate-binding protein
VFHRPSRPRPVTPAAHFVALLAASLLILVACTSGAGSTGSASAPSIAATVAPATPTLTPPPTPSPSPAAAFPLTLTDDEGGSVTLDGPPQKIVSLTPAATETLYALGAGPRVVAGTAFDDFPEAAVALPDVATFTSVDVEKIVGLEPDLVIAGGNSFNPPEAIAQLRSLGVPVLVVYAKDLDGALADVRLIGKAVGLDEEAESMATSMQSGFDAISAATAGQTKPRTFYEIDTSTGPIYTVADGSVYVEMIEKAGGDPITTGSSTSFEIPLEKLVAADPELILLGDAAYGVTPDQVKARPGWDVMTAVKDDAIRPVDDIIITRPGPRLVEGLRQLAQAIHPDLVLPSIAAIPPTP